MAITYANVHLWDRRIGVVAWDTDQELGLFEYTPEFIADGIEVAPFTIPVRAGVFSFPALSRDTYRGLPGLLADSLPDLFGHTVIDRWLSQQGRDRMSFNPVEHLCYTGTRGMGALEYQPAARLDKTPHEIHVDALADLAAEVLEQRQGLGVSLNDEGLGELLRVGTSAGGARAKAVIAWNPTTGEIQSGQVPAPPGFEYWLLKFDGVGSADARFGSPKGYGRIEHAYYLMARDCGIDMMTSRLEVDGRGRGHFMTKRFDRSDDGTKFHMQSLSALRHFDFNRAGAYSYEDAMTTTQGLGIPPAGIVELYRRMVFNVVGCNQDDHTKNIAYLMGSSGEWRLAPAFDMTWAYNPAGEWTNRHQMTIRGKRDDLTRTDLVDVGSQFGIRAPGDIIDQVVGIFARWSEYAGQAGVEERHQDAIGKTHRLSLAAESS